MNLAIMILEVTWMAVRLLAAFAHVLSILLDVLHVFGGVICMF
jgi:hypothetical protein